MAAYPRPPGSVLLTVAPALCAAYGLGPLVASNNLLKQTLEHVRNDGQPSQRRAHEFIYKKEEIRVIARRYNRQRNNIRAKIKVYLLT